MNLIIKKIQQQISDNPILLYMKGSPSQPNCGFSSQAIKILLKCDVSFSYVDILKYPEIRTTLPKLSNWPTYPQLWIDSTLIGGCDIMIEMYKKNELQKLLKKIKLKYNLKKHDPFEINNILNKNF